jgi:uncharacterized iron-regulated membrane protein
MSDTSSAPVGVNKLYFAAWRWHFFAGLYVIPFLLMLAVTGFFMMLFTTYLPEYGDRIAVVAQAEPLLPSAQAQAAIAAVPGGTGVEKYVAPRSATTPALITVSGPETPVVVALDPYTGAVLRQTEQGNTWNAWLEKIHGTLLIGDTGDRMIEVAAGLGLVMVLTGLYMWWPRDAGGLRAVLVPNFAAKGRALWKSLHMMVGFWIAVILTFFLITGMAWAGIWGGKWVQAWSTFPAEKWDSVPLSDETHAKMNHAQKEVPWVLEQTQMPESGSFAGKDVLPMGSKIDLDSMVVLGRMIGFDGRFQVAAPGDAAGVYTLSQDSMSYDSSNPTADRTVHVDQFTGKVLADVRFADYGTAGKAMAVGIALHEGQLGLWNFLVNLVFLTSIVFLCLSGIVLWWKRRPANAGRLAAPPRAQEMPLWKGAAVMAIALSMLFPLLGATLVVVLIVDVLVLQNLPSLKRALS